MKFDPNTNIMPKILQLPMVIDFGYDYEKYSYIVRFDRYENTRVIYKNGPWNFHFLTNKPIDTELIRYVVVGLEDDPVDIVMLYNGEVVENVGDVRLEEPVI